MHTIFYILSTVQMISNSINVIHRLFPFWVVFFFFLGGGGVLPLSTCICSTAGRSQAADPLVALSGGMRPRFKTVQYKLYWMVWKKLSNVAFRKGNIDFPITWCESGLFSGWLLYSGYMIWYMIYEMIRYDTIYDMIWYDMIWYDMIRYMIWYDMIWYDMIWYDMIWYDMIWYDMIWYDMTWHDMTWDMIWYDVYIYFSFTSNILRPLME